MAEALPACLNDERRRAIGRVDQFQATPRSEDADGDSVAVSRDSPWRHDGDAAASRQGHPCCGIDDVRVALAADVQVLLGVARGGDGGVMQQEVTRALIRRLG